MELSKSEEVSKQKNDGEQSDKTSKESTQEIESSKDSAQVEQKELNAIHSAQKETENVDISNVENTDVVHREAGDDNDEWVVIYKECEDLTVENDKNEKVQKETIEILNVELVAPGSDNFVKCVSSKIETTSQDNVNDKNNMPATNFCIDTVENADQAQVQDERNVKEIEMDTSDVNVAPTQVNYNQNLANCLGIDVVENSDQEQVQNEINVKEIEIDTSDVDVTPTQVNNNQNLANCAEIAENNTEPLKTSGLSLLAQYQSDDDTESVVEVPITPAQDYRNQVVEIDSDNDSDDSSDSSDVEYLNVLRKVIEKRIEVADEDDVEDEDNEDNTTKRKPRQKLRVKGEFLLEDLPPIQDLQITVPENDCILFGKIHSIVDQLVLVSALPNSILLDLETVIFLEKGQKVLGEVFDVLGQVADPLYCVRFNSNKQIVEKQIEIGDVVYVAPKTQYTQYVILSSLMKTKGSDASWENDMEPPPRFLDYSDDEQEQLAKRQQRNKDRPIDNEDSSKRPRNMDIDDSASTSSSHQPSSPYSNCNEHRNNRGRPEGHSNVYNRPRYDGPHQNQQRTTNRNPSSWHSNYYPQNFPSQPTNYRMYSSQSQPQSPQGYNPNMSAYAMHPTHNIHYPPPQPAPYGGARPMFHQYLAQHMPNTLIVPPPTFHGPPPHASHHQQFNTTSPPPPGSQ